MALVRTTVSTHLHRQTYVLLGASLMLLAAQGLLIHTAFSPKEGPDSGEFPQESFYSYMAAILQMYHTWVS